MLSEGQPWDLETLKAGEVLDDRYTIVAELGRGGMGVVYEARDLQQDGRVVVKTLLPELASNLKLRVRFTREGQALQRIRAEHDLVRVIAVQEDGPQPYIVMEYVEGRSLQELIRERGRFAPLEAIRLMRDVARDLIVIHRHGLIHRDIKPDNVRLTPTGRVRIVDFGIAKDVFASTLTETGQMMGSTFYMAPELWEGEVKPDARVDVFSLGATLYHLLVGLPPFLAEDLGDVMDAILSGDYESPRELVPDLPEQVELALAQMLMPDRRYRYSRMEECAADLDRVLRGEPCLIPSLVRETGERFPLLPGRWFTLGRDPGGEISLLDRTVSREHAQVRREEGGFVLRDLSSSHGTFVGGVRLTGPHSLADGDEVRVGDVRLTFSDPNREPCGEAYLADVAREERPPEVVHALVEEGDPRIALALLERVTTDRDLERRVDVLLTTLLRGERTRVDRRREELARDERARVEAILRKLSGEDLPCGTGEGWLAWWDRVRTQQPKQIGAAGARRALRLRVAGDAPSELALGDAGLVLLGRDPKCHLTFASRQVSRRHATLLRLHQRLAVRDEGSSSGTRVNGSRVQLAFVDPGDLLELGDVPVSLEVEETEGEVDPATFQALVEARHPSVARALVERIGESACPDGVASELFDEPVARERFAKRLRVAHRERAEAARAALSAIFEQDPGDDSHALERLLAERADDLPPQVRPTGWGG